MCVCVVYTLYILHLCCVYFLSTFLFILFSDTKTGNLKLETILYNFCFPSSQIIIHQLRVFQTFRLQVLLSKTFSFLSPHFLVIFLSQCIFSVLSFQLLTRTKERRNQKKFQIFQISRVSHSILMNKIHECIPLCILHAFIVVVDTDADADNWDLGLGNCSCSCSCNRKRMFFPFTL